MLTVARYFFQSFADPQTEGWTRAMLGAESWLGRDAAPELVHAVFHVIQKMRCARRSTFQFSNPDCPHCAATLCAHERLLLNACRSMARGRPEEAAGHAMIGVSLGPVTGDITARLVQREDVVPTSHVFSHGSSVPEDVTPPCELHASRAVATS